ncbi:MAG: response regulator [Spirulinaceae cyanobacterium]
MRILLIEDDEILIQVLVKSLESQHYTVDVAEDGQLGWEYAQDGHYELILIDVGLPRLDGVTLCQRLRSEGCAIPILLITAQDASADRIKGLDAGADDYLTKPLDLGELQARVRALLRRGEVAFTPVLEMGELVLDPNSYQVHYREQPLKLTPKEYSLLELLLRNPARVFSRGQIIERLWNYDDPPLEESVKAHVKGLRRKLKKVGVADWIENVYGIGYRLSPKLAQEGEKAENASVQQRFDEAMAQMWQQYRGLMTERLEALQEAAAAIQQGQASSELNYSAQKAAHKLAGVLGMFNKEAGTKVARQIEDLLQDKSEKVPQRGEQLLALVQQLREMLELPASSATSTARLLLIEGDEELGSQLQELAQLVQSSWHQVPNLTSARDWLKTQAPDVVVLSVAESGEWQGSFTILKDLAARTPPIPALVIASNPDLVDRVSIARCGGSRVLVKPTTATQIWQVVQQLLQSYQDQETKILVVDDDPAFLAALQTILTPWGLRITGLQEPESFWEILNSVKPDLLILDVEMPEINGIELCQAVRTDPQWQNLPILFLTAHQDRETVQQVYSAGADDYITKPIIGPELLTRITNRLERNRILKNFSGKDALTRLANYPCSRIDLATLLQQQPSCLAVLTIAELPEINLRYGHQTGNQILQSWGRLLQTAFSGKEVVGYWGYGEFVVGIPGVNSQQAGDRLASLLTTLRQQVFTAPDGTRFQVTCNWAIAQSPRQGTTIQSLYQAAIASQARS